MHKLIVKIDVSVCNQEPIHTSIDTPDAMVFESQSMQIMTVNP